MRRVPLLAILLTLLLRFTYAQTPCQVSVAPSSDASRNIFTLAQETDLGDALAEYELNDLRVLAESDAHLQQIATRLVHNTPLADLPLRTFIIDLPEANAFVIPGGRVYVSRSMLAILESDDELAGILAHELGHIAAHQQAISVSRLMKATLGVNSFSSRRDVFDKYAQLMENTWRKPSLASTSFSKEEKDQMEADRLGLSMQVAAGFDPLAQTRALDRILQTNGKTGNLFSNLFNIDPDQKRLHELVKNLPANCSTPPKTSNADFLKWRTSLLNLNSATYAEALPPAQSRLNPASALARRSAQGQLQS